MDSTPLHTTTESVIKEIVFNPSKDPHVLEIKYTEITIVGFNSYNTQTSVLTGHIAKIITSIQSAEVSSSTYLSFENLKKCTQIKIYGGFPKTCGIDTEEGEA